LYALKFHHAYVQFDFKGNMSHRETIRIESRSTCGKTKWRKGNHCWTFRL